MLKSTALDDRVADMLAAISTAAKALFKHTTKAISVRGNANRITVMGTSSILFRFKRRV